MSHAKAAVIQMFMEFNGTCAPFLKCNTHDSLETILNKFFMAIFAKKSAEGKSYFVLLEMSEVGLEPRQLLKTAGK